ncbi:Leucine Rich Repeat [Pseudomonas mucidolens]|uniref:RING-type E3 ubiquitin transferase n=1 Tax=Pseudomonas mucidolens TaxID=46679 RepID=A0A1H2NL55_9PSED|nr:Leucine Rich Repeat [Pseudomonas mucidolens]SQH31656.1 leucine-rich repeat-containing protein [Pseudomonas mucidolens]
MTVAQFTKLCRSLDIGAKYQVYLKSYVQPGNAGAHEVLRHTFKNAQQTAMRMAAEVALLKQDIAPGDYTMVLSVINGNVQPLLDGKRVSLCEFGLMGIQMTGCVLFSVGDLYGRSDELILYIPNDPLYPLKRYTRAEMTDLFKQRLTARDVSLPDDGSPTTYQRFFSQFVAYADRPYYFKQFTQDGPVLTIDQALDQYAPLLIELSGIDPYSLLYLPNEQPPPQVPNLDPYLAPGAMLRKGAGIGTRNLWDYLFEQHRDKLIADARAHAVPSADVDAKARSEKLARLLNISLLGLTGISMFVPALGQLMMGAMVAQLLVETCEAAHEWSLGDRQAAKAHLIDVAQNLAFMAVMAGGGKVLGRLTAVKAEPVIEALEPVTLSNGETRLWKPDLSGYESPVSLDRSSGPNAMGQYELDGKTYIRQDGKAYQQTYDETLKCWRIEHPSNPWAYKPRLTHNGAGAWRHTLERPLTWDRLTLLRRMGHVTQIFADEQLLRIADISGVSDNVLRKMHMDSLPPPPELTNTLRLFEAGQGVDEVISQIEGEQAVDGRYLYVLPLVVDLPRWPQGRGLEVFETTDLTGGSLKYGSGRQLPPGEVKAPVRICRADVMSGALPARILQGLDEAEILHLLGGEPARVKATRPENFRKQIVDFVKTRQPDVFESLYKGSEPKARFVAQMQRVTPGLSEAAADAVLAQANSEEFERLASTARFPLRMLEHARWYAQHGRLSNAYAGLHLENMASVDSKRLALHALQKLPGWSDSVRLEVRDTSGVLIHGIGSETAPVPNYLVKKGPVYQAFDEQGTALDSNPLPGDNFFPSLMRVLPDDARQAMGVPDISQHAELRKAIIGYAIDHPGEMAQALEQHAAKKNMNKLPIRLKDKRVGYYASGRGPGMEAPLVARVRAAYPGLTDQQANSYVLKLRRTGQTDVQVYAYLQARLSEWQTLVSTLEAWVSDRSPALQTHIFVRREIMDSLKASWRNAPLADQELRFSQLSLVAVDPLPLITADFSHVRDLKLNVPNAEAFLERCASVETLEVQVMQDNPDRVFESLKNLRKLRNLNLNTPITAQLVSELKVLSNLEELNLTSPVGGGGRSESPVLDIRGFSRLRRLQVSDSQTKQWPTGVLELPLLERLNLRATGIDTLPADLYPGRDRLLAGLSLDWSKVAREDFKPIYEYVRNRPRHLIDTSEMVRDYCKGELFRLAEIDPQYFNALHTNVAELWPEPQARFDAVEALSMQRSELDRQLERWLGTTSQPSSEGRSMSTVASTLKVSWCSELVRQYVPPTDLPLHVYGLSGLTRDPSMFVLFGLQLASLPELPAGFFAHVKTLILKQMRVPDQHLQRFVLAFNEIRTLDLSNGELTAMRFKSDELPALEHLNLSHNPLTEVDVSPMSRLHSLSVRGTPIKAWPVGAEHLPEPIWLDLRDTPISTLPQSALDRDQVLINTHLSGTPLSVQACAELAAARQRFEQTRGLSPGTLARFAQDRVLVIFPPTESDCLNIHHLLPLLPAEMSRGSQSLQTRMRRLLPVLNEHEARQWIEKMYAQGIPELQLHERIDGWNQTFEALTRRLNDWLLIRAFREGNWEVSSQTRQAAALRILECWREGLLTAGSQASAELNLIGLRLGDLPELSGAFTHVATLGLRGVGLTEQGSNDFLRAFPNVRTLDLGGNPLEEALPDAIAGMTHLQHLDLSYTSLTASEAVYRSLRGLQHLQRLNLANCDLESFRLDGFRRLQNLDLQNNWLTQWPEGVWQSESLLRLNLSGNDLASIPPQALDGTHDLLMSNTNLFDNRELSRDSLERLRGYAHERQLDPVLGFTRSELDELINDFGGDDSNDTESTFSDEVVPEGQGGRGHLSLWLESLAPETQAASRALWAQLEGEPGHEALFHLLRRLQDTAEFNFSRADLTRRVWEVLKAAGSDSELRQVLFRLSDTHGTCVDGRILTFSGLEVKVFEYNALLEVNPAHLDQKGPALLKLSRQLFRLGEVEKLADKDISARGRHADPAEVRLEYRLGLQGLLDLPGQPGYMMYGKPITGMTLIGAFKAVKIAEATDAFYEDLITRDYWVDYLKEKYPKEFTALEQNSAQKHEKLENDHATFSEAYSEAASVLEVELTTERNKKLLELSRQEASSPPLSERDPDQPGTSKDLMGGRSG